MKLILNICALILVMVLLVCPVIKSESNSNQIILEEEEIDLKLEELLNINYFGIDNIGDRWQRDIVYKNINGEKLTLDLFLPEKKLRKNYPVILYIHGGGFIRGDKSEVFELSPLFEAWLENGWAVVSINYRLLIGDNMFPDNLEDVHSALQWIKKNSNKYNFDVDNIGLVGHSAGGNLALLAGLSKEESIKFIVSMAGPTKLYGEDNFELRKKLIALLNRKEVDREAMENGSPISLLSKDSPPVLLIHGTDDKFVPYEQSQIFYEKAIKMDVECKLITVQGGGHILSLSYLPRLHALKDQIMTFLQDKFK